MEDRINKVWAIFHPPSSHLLSGVCVYVVDAEEIARQKHVTLGQLQDGLRVVKEGLTPEDRVIVNGLTTIRPARSYPAPTLPTVAPLGDTDVPQWAGADQPMAAASGGLVSSNSAGSNRASRRLYSFANAGQVVKLRPSAPTYHE